MPSATNRSSKKSILFAISLILLVPSAAFALDAEYYRTLARSYIEDGELHRAKTALADGLAQFPDDNGLKQIQADLHAMDAKAKADHDEAYAKEIREKDEAWKQHLKDQEALQAKRQVEFLKKAFCACQVAKARSERKIRDENVAGGISGVVNKETLYTRGQIILKADRTISFIQRDAKRQRVVLDTCADSDKVKGYEEAVCSEFYLENRKRIEKE